VKSKHRIDKAGQTSSVDGSMRRAPAPLPTSSMRKLSLEYKKQLWGKCFQCLATNHKVAHYCDPPRCLNCLCSGHLARRCNAPPKPHHQKPSIHSRLTFPPSSIHSRLTFLNLSYAKAAAGPPPMAPTSFVVGSPCQRPLLGQASVTATRAMMAQLQKLRRREVILTTPT
jgi:hypothetical protein